MKVRVPLWATEVHNEGGGPFGGRNKIIWKIMIVIIMVVIMVIVMVIVVVIIVAIRVVIVMFI